MREIRDLADDAPLSTDEPEKNRQETILDRIEAGAEIGPWPVVGLCVDDRHPILRGRVRIRLDGQANSEIWMPVLQSVAVRASDRVLVCRPTNSAEPVVIGVIDGFARRPENETRAASITLQPDEVIRIHASNAEPLVEIAASATGPVVRLLRQGVDLEVEGKLRIRASELELQATLGEARIEASADVVVRGENIQLN